MLVLLKNNSFTSYQKKETPAGKLFICTYGSTPAGQLFICSSIYFSAATPLYSSAFTSPILLLKNDSSSMPSFQKDSSASSSTSVLLKNNSSTSSFEKEDYVVSPVTALVPEKKIHLQFLRLSYQKKDSSSVTALLPPEKKIHLHLRLCSLQVRLY